MVDLPSQKFKVEFFVKSFSSDVLKKVSPMVIRETTNLNTCDGDSVFLKVVEIYQQEIL